jgi:hypothetical protein
VPHVPAKATARMLARQHEALDARRVHVVQAVKQRHGREAPVHAAHTQMLRSHVLECLCLLYVARAREGAALRCHAPRRARGEDVPGLGCECTLHACQLATPSAAHREGPPLTARVPRNSHATQRPLKRL